jgi:hypothetical protein
VSGGTRAPTRVSGGQPTPRGPLGRLASWVPWAVASVLALACVALGVVLLTDDES